MPAPCPSPTTHTPSGAVRVLRWTSLRGRVSPTQSPWLTRGPDLAAVQWTGSDRRVRAWIRPYSAREGRCPENPLPPACSPSSLSPHASQRLHILPFPERRGARWPWSSNMYFSLLPAFPGFGFVALPFYSGTTFPHLDGPH